MSSHTDTAFMLPSRARLMLSILLAVPLLTPLAGAGSGPRGGPPHTNYTCTITATVTRGGTSTNESWEEVLSFYVDPGRNNTRRFVAGNYSGRWKKRPRHTWGRDVDWRGDADISRNMARSIMMNERLRSVRVTYKYRDLQVRGGTISGKVRAVIKRRHEDGTRTVEYVDGTLSGVYTTY